MPESDEGLQPPPGTGGIPPGSHLLHHYLGHGEQQLRRHSTDPRQWLPS
jgi:hypothetical protein